MNSSTRLAGLHLYPGHLDHNGQADLLAAVRAISAAAPPFTPRMPKSGRPFTVRMSNCGPLGWVSDQSGYRYQPRHPGDRAALAADTGDAASIMGRVGPPSGPARGLSDQLLCPDRKNGSASGSRRGGFRCAGGLDFAGRFLPVPRRRTETQRAHPHLPPQLGRRPRPRRRRPPCLPWRRSNLSGHIKLAPGRGTDQSDLAPGDAERGRNSAPPIGSRGFAW